MFRQKITVVVVAFREQFAPFRKAMARLQRSMAIRVVILLVGMGVIILGGPREGGHTTSLGNFKPATQLPRLGQGLPDLIRH